MKIKMKLRLFLMVLNHNDGMSDICIEKSVTYGFNTKPPLSHRLMDDQRDQNHF